MIEKATNKAISFILILVFVGIGILGVILPILPGIPFLFIAAIIASRHIPALENYLQQHPYTAKSLRQTNRFNQLTFVEKVRFCCWAFLGMLVESVEWGIATFSRLFKRWPIYREV